MKTKTLTIALCLATGVTLSSCDRVRHMLAGGEPKGQVVATVDGKEITALQLRQEMGGFASRDPKVMKAAQQAALERLILRTLVAEKAQKDKLDKTADYALLAQRQEQDRLAQLYQSNIAKSVAVPSRQEAEAFVTANPDRFANRQVLVVNQLLAQRGDVTPEQLRPLKTLDEVRAFYDSKSMPTQANVATIDTLTLPPNVAQQIQQLPPGEVFVLPQRNELVFNQIIEAKGAPFRGDAAVAYATNLLHSQKIERAISQQIQLLRKSSEKSITYNEAYKPSPSKQKVSSPNARSEPSSAGAPNGA